MTSRMTKSRALKKAKGLVRIELWHYPEYRDILKKMEADLIAKRENQQ